jgi:hypothetical protein
LGQGKKYSKCAGLNTNFDISPLLIEIFLPMNANRPIQFVLGQTMGQSIVVYSTKSE